MRKQKNKINRDIDKMILEKAKELPKMYKTDAAGNPLYKSGVVDGSLLDTNDKSGNKGIHGVKYTGQVLQYENHYLNLVNAYQIDGMTGFEHYVKNVERVHAERLAYVEKAQPWWVKLFRLLKFWN